MKKKIEHGGNRDPSPLKRICLEAGIPLDQLGLASNTSTGVLWRATNGFCSIPKKVLNLLESMGYDTDALKSEQDAFRKSKQQEAAELLMNRGGAR